MEIIIRYNYKKRRTNYTLIEMNNKYFIVSDRLRMVLLVHQIFLIIQGKLSNIIVWKKIY